MSPKTICTFLVVLAVCISVVSRPCPAADAPQANALTAEEIADGWLLLFDGESLYGWEPSSKADWKVADGIIGVTSGEKGLLCTTCQWADYVFKADFRAGLDQQRRIPAHAQGA